MKTERPRIYGRNGAVQVCWGTRGTRWALSLLMPGQRQNKITSSDSKINTIMYLV